MMALDVDLDDDNLNLGAFTFIMNTSVHRVQLGYVNRKGHEK
jgi:hypothetical protein